MHGDGGVTALAQTVARKAEDFALRKTNTADIGFDDADDDVCID